MNFKFSMGPQHTEMFKNLKCQRKIITITSAIVIKLKNLSLSRPPSTHSVADLTLAIVCFDQYNVVTIDESQQYSHRCCCITSQYFFQFCYDCRCYSYHFSLTLQIFKHFRMLGPHRKFEVHTSFSCRERANDAHNFSTNLGHYPYAKALARLLGESCQHIFYFDAFSPSLRTTKTF